MKKLNKQISRAIAYAQNALSFLTFHQDINAIYLFGSSVRGELEEESDIDLFVDCSQNEREIESLLKEAFSRFYSSKDYDKWKILRFTYPLSTKVGKLEDWELKTSIQAEGMILYSKQICFITGIKQVLFLISLPKKKTKYLKLVRELYGRKEKGYSGKGLLEELKGKKLNSNAIIVPKENSEIIKKLLNKENIEYSFREMILF